jgi:hypothetical protein
MSTIEKRKLRPESKELLGLKFIRPIGVDLFFAGIDNDSNLPEQISKDPELLRLVGERRSLSKLFDQVMDNPTTENRDFFYDQISDFILEDENNARILLYLPFEVLPNLKNTDGQASDSSQRFADVYRESWVRLLYEIEARASFIDGDVLEEGLPKPERISKAGHLTAEILEKGIISARDIINLLNIIENPQILKSLTEGTFAARDKNLIEDDDWKKIAEIIDAVFQNDDTRLALLDHRVVTPTRPLAHDVDVGMKAACLFPVFSAGFVDIFIRCSHLVHCSSVRGVVEGFHIFVS